MARYIAGRLLRAVLTVTGVVTLVFLLVRLVPGDPVDVILGDQADPEDRAALRAALHLDRPYVEQYFAFVGEVLDGTLGHSFRQRGVAVSTLLRDAIPHTVALAGASLVVSWCLGMGLGLWAAVRHRTAVDATVSVVAVLGLAVPTIVLGPLLVWIFGVLVRWLPLPGDSDAGAEALILPALTVGTALAALLMRQTRAAMLEILPQPYVVAAAARGLGRVRVVVKHAFRNALLPIATVAAVQLGSLLTGTVIAERIFERQGIGTLFLDAFSSRDIPVVQGTVLVIALVYVLVNLALDVAYSLADPRVRLE